MEPNIDEFELGKYFDLTNDYAFKCVFGNEANKQLLIDMINSFLPDRKVVSFKYNNNEQLGLSPDNMAVRFDLHCTDEKGEKFIVEIQKRANNNFYQRALYYGSLLYASTAESGDSEYKTLKPVYVISLLCEPLKASEFQGLDDLILWYQMSEKTHKSFAPNGINIIFVNIFRAAKSIENCTSEGERWCQIIRDMNSYKCEPQEIGGGKWEKLAEASKLAAHNKDTIVEYRKAIMDANYNKVLIKESFEDGLEKGLEKGIERGKAEGEAQKAIAIAMAMLSNGISADVVSTCTGLTLAQISAL